MAAVRARLVRLVAVAAAVALQVAAEDKNNPDNYPKWLPRLSDLRILDPKWNAHPRWKSDKDCLGYARQRIMRPYPGNCYTKGGRNLEYQSQWWNFWRENRGDITYTFDHVFMFDSKNVIDQPFEDQFWYNIAYLKQLRISIPEPEDIASRSSLEGDMRRQFKKKAAALDEMEKGAMLNKRRMLALKAKLHSKLRSSRK